jgi:endonuclease YncB( thermonuclease family)
MSSPGVTVDRGAGTVSPPRITVHRGTGTVAPPGISVHRGTGTASPPGITVHRGTGTASPPGVTGHRGGGAPPETFSGQVEYVFDGDTFALAGRRQRVRLWGIDAPETDEPAGPAATAALRGLISGRALACRAHAIDRYGRIVGECALPDGGDLAARLLATGTVREDCRATGNRYGTC